MQQWVYCPICGKRLIEKNGLVVQIEGGSIGAWCKPCKQSKTRLRSVSEKVHR